jgi:hypothetical protein
MLSPPKSTATETKARITHKMNSVEFVDASVVDLTEAEY